MMDGIVKIMIDVILILGIVTKEAGQGRTSMSFPVDFTPNIDLLVGKFVKKLVGKNDVEDALQRLDKLTQEVALLAESIEVVGKTSRKLLPESGGSNPSPFLRPISRTASVGTHHNTRHRAPPVPPSSFGRGGHVDMDLNSQAGPRAGPTRAATTGNNTRPSLLPTVREVLPEGFRYVLRP